MSSIFGDPPGDLGFGPAQDARTAAERFLEHDALAFVLDLRRWFQTWALDLHRQLESQLGDEAIVTEATLELYVSEPSAHVVSEAIRSVDRQWRLALGLAAGRWDVSPMTDGPLRTVRDLRAALEETMISPDEFGLVLTSSGAGSFKSSWERSRARRFLVNPELAALLAILSFAGIDGPAVGNHLKVQKPDGVTCTLRIEGTGLPTAQRERLLHEVAELPAACAIEIELKTASNQTAKLTLPGPLRPAVRSGRFKL